MGTRLKVKGITFDHWHTLNYARFEKGPEGLNRLVLRELVRNNLTVDKEDFLSTMRNVETRLQKGWKKTGRAVTIHEVFRRAARNVGLVLQKVDVDGIVGKAILRWVESELVVTYAGTREILRRLARKYQLGLISNTPSSGLTYAVLAKSDLLRYFQVVVLSADVGWAKPHGKIFRHALRGLRLKPGEVVHVGDSSAEDIAGAKSVGMKAIHVARYERPSRLADMWISSLSQLPSLLRI